MKKGRLVYGDRSFKAFASDVEFMDIASLRALVGHAQKGLPIILTKTPKQPGVNKSEEYKGLLNTLKSLPNVSDNPDKALEGINPVMKVKGDAGKLPEFWCREDKGDRYIFIANPAACAMSYHLRYGQAFEDNGSVVEVEISTRKGMRPYTLNFKPNQSILLKVSSKGHIKEIPLDFEAKRIEGPGVYD